MKKKILIVEDDPDILFTIRLMLEADDYEVAAYESGKKMVDGNYECPDLFILDKRMPDIDGLDLCRALRKKDESKNIPVIIISASPRFGAQALQAGATDFLEKPFEMKTLLRMVQKYTNSGSGKNPAT